MKSIRHYLVIFFCFYSSLCAAQWSKKATIPGAGRDAACEFSIGDKVYFGGGEVLSDLFWEYDPATNIWTPKANIPVAIRVRTFGVSFSIGSKGYVAFGQSDTSGQATVTNDLWEYDPAADQWTPKAKLPGAARDGAMAFVVNGKAYVGAGVDADAYYLGDFYEYDPAMDHWTRKADLPGGPLGFPITFAVDSLGYMVGGGDPNELSDAWSYDPSVDEWNPISPFPGAAREAGVGFCIDSLGYVGLGESNYSVTYADFYSYDPQTDIWTNAAQNFPYKLGLGWPAVAVANNVAYIGGGADKNFTFSQSWYAYSVASAGVTTAVADNSPRLYPNPAINVVNLDLPDNENSVSIIVRNEIGVACLTAKMNSIHSLDISSLRSGIYDLEITSGEHHSVQRIVKE